MADETPAGRKPGTRNAAVRKAPARTVQPAAAISAAAPDQKPAAAIEAAPVVLPPKIVRPALAAVPLSMKAKTMSTETLTKTIESVVPAMEKAGSDMVAQTQAAQEQMTAKVRELMEKNMKSMTEMTEFAKGNVEAMIESAKAAAAGAETMTSHFVETSKKSVEEAQAAFKTITSAKSPNEMMAAQNEFAKAQFDKAVAQMSHMSETWMKLAGEVMQPLSNRMAIATETVKKSIAA